MPLGPLAQGSSQPFCSDWAARSHHLPTTRHPAQDGGSSHFHQNVVSKITQQLGRFPVAIPHRCLYFHTSKAQPPLTGCKNTTETTERKHREGSCVTTEKNGTFATHLLVSSPTPVCARGTCINAAQNERGATVGEEAQKQQV